MYMYLYIHTSYIFHTFCNYASTDLTWGVYSVLTVAFQYSGEPFRHEKGTPENTTASYVVASSFNTPAMKRRPEKETASLLLWTVLTHLKNYPSVLAGDPMD